LSGRLLSNADSIHPIPSEHNSPGSGAEIMEKVGSIMLE
jgi:hypothetical protein